MTRLYKRIEHFAVELFLFTQIVIGVAWEAELHILMYLNSYSTKC
jgi:hypothetical protein